MVVEVLVAQRQCHHPLADQTLYRVFHQLRVPIVAKAGRELTQQTRPLFDLAQQEPTAVRAQSPTVKSGHNLTLSNPLETQLFNATLCLFHAAASPVYQVVADTQLNSTVRRFFLTHGEKCGLAPPLIRPPGTFSPQAGRRATNLDARARAQISM